MATTAPVDRLTGTVDALPFAVDTVGDRVAWTAVALDHMDGWGDLDSWDYGTLDALSLEVKVSGGTAAVSASAASDSVRVKTVSASVNAAVSSSSDITRIRAVAGDVQAINTASSAFLRVRPFEALVNAVGNATSDITRVRTVSASVAMSASATSSSNFLTFAQAAASTQITSAANVFAVFNGASTGKAVFNGSLTMVIRGEQWASTTPATPPWSVAATQVGVWSAGSTAAAGNWIGQ